MSHPGLPAGSDNANIVGTNAWAADGGAPLTFAQKLSQLLGANLAYLEELPAELRWVFASRGLAAHKHVPTFGIEELPQAAAVELAATELERYAEGETEILLNTAIARSISLSCCTNNQAPAYRWTERCLPWRHFCTTSGFTRKPLLRSTASTSPSAARASRGESHRRRGGPSTGWIWRPRQSPSTPMTSPSRSIGARRPLWAARSTGRRGRSVLEGAPRRRTEHLLGLACGRSRPRDPSCRNRGSCAPPGKPFRTLQPLFPFLVMNCERRWQRRLAS